MKVISKATMPNGTAIQIEDWHENYSHMPYADTVAAYPISKVSLPGSFSPKGNEVFRAQFNFKTTEEAQNAYSQLVAGTKTLTDYAANLWYPQHAACL